MSVRPYKAPILVGAAGVVIVVAHAALGLFGAVAAAQWASGAVIGLVLVVAALLHGAGAVFTSRSRSRHDHGQDHRDSGS
jgi:hypothetical protein